MGDQFGKKDSLKWLPLSSTITINQPDVSKKRSVIVHHSRIETCFNCCCCGLLQSSGGRPAAYCVTGWRRLGARWYVIWGLYRRAAMQSNEQNEYVAWRRCYGDTRPAHLLHRFSRSCPSLLAVLSRNMSRRFGCQIFGTDDLISAVDKMLFRQMFNCYSPIRYRNKF